MNKPTKDKRPREAYLIHPEDGRLIMVRLGVPQKRAAAILFIVAGLADLEAL